MSEQNQERWRLLCEQAVVEEDSNRLLELVEEINDLLDAQQEQRYPRDLQS
jgi:hypothetical protein